MSSPTYIIDPDGEVIIILRNANSPFAQLAPNPSTRRDSNNLPWLFSNTKSFRGVTEAPESPVEEPELSAKEKRKKRKEKKRKPCALLTALKSTSPNGDPATADAAAEEYPADVPAAEEAAAEEYPADVPAAEEAAAEEYPADVPAAEEAAAEEYPAAVPAAEEAAVQGGFTELAVRSCFRIQVSAKHLMLASPVFKKILTGGWKESITYFQQGSIEITAESWDIEALMILLRVIHGKYHHVPRKLTLEMLAKIGVIADYYDCKETMYFLTDMWILNMEENIPTEPSRDLMLWLWIAWFFELPSQFKLSTSIAMSQSEGWIDMLGLPIPDNIIDSMNKYRERAINNLIVVLHETRNAFLHGARGCCFECRSIMYGALTLQMQSVKLLSPKPEAPFPDLSYNYLVRMAMAFTSPAWHDRCSSYSRYGSNYQHRCSDASFASIFDMLKDSLEGLELIRFAS
ncbi:hypothetical protein N7492_000856 [Penicillium capsulatum]|uniref:BTB domain-containing protein n=1 Tax=Penicillium capsulatum TaxID=69766 RepID=A0A9W9IUF4_9EURO|nr:hypothetical protein N7492_000856 [Penicillium capsulatum]KAJ6130086.1 hypothetical protein N7512_002866 [Penicillium capsulatum]